MINRILLTTLLLSLCFGLLVNDADAQDSIDQELSVFLASPGEDETFYIAPNGFLVSVPIAGQVISYGAPLRPDIIELTLELINEAGDVLQVTPPIDEFGHFEVWATITSPDAFLPMTEIREGDLCSSCHQIGDLSMPAGVTQLVIHVHTGDGRSISTTRSMRLDQGVFRNLPVRVEGLPAEVTDAQIRATTVIYDWRPRTFFADVNDRQAVVSLEGLTYTNLTYDVSLIPVVIDETLYTTSTEREIGRAHV